MSDVKEGTRLPALDPNTSTLVRSRSAVNLSAVRRQDMSRYFTKLKILEAFLLRVLKVARKTHPRDLTSFILDALFTNERSLKAQHTPVPVRYSHAEQKKYNTEVIDPLLSDMMAKLLLEQPNDPKEWMLQYLMIRQRLDEVALRNQGSSLDGSLISARSEVTSDSDTSTSTSTITTRPQLTSPSSHASQSSMSTMAQVTNASSSDQSIRSNQQSSGSTTGPTTTRRKTKTQEKEESESEPDPDSHLKPHIAVAPPQSEIQLIYQSLILSRSPVEQCAVDNNITLEFGSINPFFLQQRFSSEIRALQGNQKLFFDAFMGRDIEKMDMLLSHGFAIPSDPLVGGWTPLMTATRLGWTQIVKLLLSHGASPLDARPSDELTPLFLAIASQNTDMIDLLFSWKPMREAKLDSSIFAMRQMAHVLSRSTNENPFTFAARKGYYQVVEFLLTKMHKLKFPKRTQRKFVNHLNAMNASALFKAVVDGREKMVQVLTASRHTKVNLGAFLNLSDKPEAPVLPLSPAELEAKTRQEHIRKLLPTEAKETDAPPSNEDEPEKGKRSNDKQKADDSNTKLEDPTSQPRPVDEQLTAGDQVSANEPTSDSTLSNSAADSAVQLVPLASPVQAALTLGHRKILAYLLKKGAYVADRIPINPWISPEKVSFLFHYDDHSVSFTSVERS